MKRTVSAVLAVGLGVYLVGCNAATETSAPPTSDAPVASAESPESEWRLVTLNVPNMT